MHSSENPLILSGDAIECEDAFIVKVQPDHTPRNYLHLLIFKSFMCSFYGNHELGAKLALERGDAYLKKNGSVLVMSDFFHQAISLFAMCRKTKKRKYIKRAKKITATIKSWAKKGNPNVNHFIMFLGAERAALNGKHKEARILYSQAISTASRTGFQQDAALGSERFGEFLLHDLGDKERAISQLKDAIRLYTNWGAIYKADTLRQRYSNLLSNEMPEIIEWF
jgi:tetratricopeptide (TPR) repeat protein